MQLERSDFRTTLIEILRKISYPATGLCLEMAQSSRQLGMEHLKSQIEFLKSCGIKVGLDVSDFAAGTYSVKIIGEAGEMSTRFVKVK